MICWGDSFTLGYGVANEETWCARVSREAPAIETVNMGQGGYGIDQSFLWYRRDGHSLAHQLHVLAFIHEDFLRMESDRFFGYGKPVLALQSGRLVPQNVPVPRRAYDAPWLTTNEQLLSELRSFVLLRALARRILPAPPRSPPGVDLLPLALHVFEELHALNRARGPGRLAPGDPPGRGRARNCAAGPGGGLSRASRPGLRSILPAAGRARPSSGRGALHGGRQRLRRSAAGQGAGGCRPAAGGGPAD